MMKMTATALLAAAMLVSTGAFAASEPTDNACCVQTIANTGNRPCADLTALNLNADQKTKIEAWQEECMKDGCTKQSRKKFFQQAKGVLSAEQFAKLKAACKKGSKQGAKHAKTQT